MYFCACCCGLPMLGCWLEWIFFAGNPPCGGCALPSSPSLSSCNLAIIIIPSMFFCPFLLIAHDRSQSSIKVNTSCPSIYVVLSWQFSCLPWTIWLNYFNWLLIIPIQSGLLSSWSYLTYAEYKMKITQFYFLLSLSLSASGSAWTDRRGGTMSASSSKTRRWLW